MLSARQGFTHEIKFSTVQQHGSNETARVVFHVWVLADVVFAHLLSKFGNFWQQKTTDKREEKSFRKRKAKRQDVMNDICFAFFIFSLRQGFGSKYDGLSFSVWVQRQI